jgi:hypothetical protein
MTHKTATDYTITTARYARNSVAIRPVSNGTGFKTRAHRLCDHLRARWSNRENAYITSPTKAARFEQLYAEGYDASNWSRELIAPGKDD